MLLTRKSPPNIRINETVHKQDDEVCDGQTLVVKSDTTVQDVSPLGILQLPSRYNFVILKEFQHSEDYNCRLKLLELQFSKYVEKKKKI